MSNQNEIQIVLGSKQFAGNTDKDIWIQPPLIGDRRTMVEGDRSITVNLNDQFETERQDSDTFRISGKITNIFQNTVSGKTTYTPYRNILYYTCSRIENLKPYLNFIEKVYIETFQQQPAFIFTLKELNFFEIIDLCLGLQPRINQLIIHFRFSSFYKEDCYFILRYSKRLVN